MPYQLAISIMCEPDVTFENLSCVHGIVCLFFQQLAKTICIKKRKMKYEFKKRFNLGCQISECLINFGEYGYLFFP